MAYTALDGMNLVLRRVGQIQGDQGDLTSFEDSARQRWIDTSLQVINEGIQRLTTLGVVPNEVREGSITLVDGQREYAKPADFIEMSAEGQMDRVMVNTVNSRVLHEYPGGYVAMFHDQPDPSDWQGDPNHWTINPETDQFRLDRTPQADQAGDVYKFLYDKLVRIITEGDSFPFADTVFDQMLAPIAEVVRASMKNEVRLPVYAAAGFANAVKTARQTKGVRQYGVRRA